ncbi:hypothetical protein KI387_013808, partial [Taxus chinensis]
VSPSSAHPADHIHFPIPESHRTVPDWSVYLQSTPILPSRRRSHQSPPILPSRRRFPCRQ